MIVRSWFLLFFLTLAGAVYPHFIVFRQNGDQRINPTIEEFKAAQAILVRYQFPMYVYDPAISAADKNSLDLNEVGFLQQKIQAEVAQDLRVQAISPTLYDLIVLRINWTAVIVGQVIKWLEYIESTAGIADDKQLFLQPHVRQVMATGPYSGQEWLSVLDAAEQSFNPDTCISLKQSDIMFLRCLLACPVFDQTDCLKLFTGGSVQTRAQIHQIKDEFKSKYAHFITLADKFENINSQFVKLGADQFISISIETRNVNGVETPVFSHPTYDEAKKYLNDHFGMYVNLCRTGAQTDVCTQTGFFVNQFFLTNPCCPRQILHECIGLTVALYDWHARASLVQGESLVLQAIALEQSKSNFSFIYRGTGEFPAAEWRNPSQEVHSLSFGKTLLSSFLSDNDLELIKAHKIVGVGGAVPLSYMVFCKYGYALSINHAQYRRDFEKGVNILFIQPFTTLLDLFGQGEGFHPRRKIIKYPLHKLIKINEIKGLEGDDGMEMACFFMAPWESYQAYKHHAETFASSIVMLKGT